MLAESVLQRLDTLSIPTAVVFPTMNNLRLGASEEDAQLTITVINKAAAINLIRGEIGKIAEDYVEGRIDIDGNIFDLMTVAEQVLPDDPRKANRSWIEQAAHVMIRHIKSVLSHTMSRDSHQIRHHYDVSDEFYALWLDPKRVYSCAYYAVADIGRGAVFTSTLGEAQERKLEHIANKLRLSGQDKFLDVGAGWGGLLMHAAPKVAQATGITLSANQYTYVKQLIQSEGHSGKASMHLMDYRDLGQTFETSKFDKIASVGMFEHVGRANLTTYFKKMRSLLRPGGLFLNHGITSGAVGVTQLSSGMGDFIGRYIFPGGELVHISDVLRAMDEAGLEVVDVENLRPHYARTLWNWSAGLENNLEEATKLVGEAKVRAYRMYLAGSAMAFEKGWISLHQVLATTPHETQYPFDRSYMYPVKT